jgi:hypothetical protein
VTVLDGYLKLTVDRGRTRAADDNRCGSFVKTSQQFSGRLSDLPRSYETARRGTRWAHGAGYTYRFRLTLVSANAAQGRSTGFGFVWEARP